ncbi:hypothetical protein BJH93_07020 [Kocuria polaris]|nr:hypothetical protein [Kocuria polaris]
MEDARFWDIIDRSLDASDGSVEGQIVALEEILAQLSPAEIASFDEAFVSKKSDLYTWDLWGAAYVLNGGCSDDCFDYFRTWVVGQGRHYYDAVRLEPHTLGDGGASISAESFDAELIAYVSADAYERASGGRDLFTDYPMSPSAGDAEEPSGEEWDEDEVDSLYPELESLPWPDDEDS